MASLTDNIEMYLYQALESRFGIELRVSDFVVCRAKILTTRAKLGDPRLAVLEVRASPADPQNTIWIVRKDAQVPEEYLDANIDQIEAHKRQRKEL